MDTDSILSLGVLTPPSSGFDLVEVFQEAIEAQIHGTPWVSQLFWSFQELGYNCSVAVQNCILKYFGIDIPEAELTQLARNKGWLTDDGARMSDIGRLLEYYGIEMHSKEYATLADLISEIEQGHAVMIPADFGELWADTFLERLWEWMEDVLGMPDHVVWITGIDMSDPDNPQVIVNDTGHPDGAGQRYPLSEFMDAWEDARFTYIATDSAPPDHEAYVGLERSLREA